MEKTQTYTPCDGIWLTLGDDVTEIRLVDRITRWSITDGLGEGRGQGGQAHGENSKGDGSHVESAIARRMGNSKSYLGTSDREGILVTGMKRKRQQ